MNGLSQFSGENLNQKTLGGEHLPECRKSHVCLCDLLQLQYSQLRSAILSHYNNNNNNNKTNICNARSVSKHTESEAQLYDKITQ